MWPPHISCVDVALGLHGDQRWSCLLDSTAHFLWREVLVAQHLSCLMPISLLPLARVCLCSSLLISPQGSSTASCGAQQPDSILKPKKTCFDFPTCGESDLGQGTERRQSLNFWTVNNADFVIALQELKAARDWRASPLRCVYRLRNLGFKPDLVHYDVSQFPQTTTRGMRLKDLSPSQC